MNAANGRARGLAVWFTGLSGSGKTTLCRALETEMRSLGHPVCVLDADELRRTVNRDLGFSKADRDENVARIAALALGMVEEGAIVLVAAISPYRDARAAARKCIGDFLEVYVDAPLSTCMERDPKGLYAKAMEGELEYFTGIDDPYEAPLAPEIHLNTARESIAACVARVQGALEEALRGRVAKESIHLSKVRLVCRGP